MNTRRKAVIAVSVVIVAAAAGVGGWQLDHYVDDAEATCLNAGVTVILHADSSGDCAGVTDGSYRFDPGNRALDDVEGKIKTEDQRVRSSGKPYVSVAYLLPFSTNSGSAVPIKAAAEELAGAYTAQRFANTHDVEGIAGPQIQLLIASNGTQGGGYQAVDRLIENDVGSQHLAAVAGIGVSLNLTVTEVRDLTRAGIPVFGSDTSSDTFDSVKNMVRVSPSNSAMVSAVLGYIKHNFRSAFLISDQNESDSYVTTLVADFPRFSGKNNKIVESEEYDSNSGDASGRVGQMAGDICASQAQVVLFAGRGRDLESLLAAFGNREQCGSPDNPDGKIAIITGGDVTNLQVNSAVKAGLQSVDLYYAGETIPGQWRDPGCEAKAKAVGPTTGYADFAGAYPFGAELPDQDGVAMIGYDAAISATSAIRLAAANGVSDTPAGVAQELSALQGKQHAVSGASGPVSFANYGNPKDGSNPARKVFPILKLLPTGDPRFVECVQTSP